MDNLLQCALYSYLNDFTDNWLVKKNKLIVAQKDLVGKNRLNPYSRLLKGVFAKKERGYRLNAKNNRFWSLLILLLSVASIWSKLLKPTYTEERNATQYKCKKLQHITRIVKKINLIQTYHSVITTDNHR